MDLKMSYQDKVEELAQERYNKEFYELPDDIRYALSKEAEHIVNEHLIAAADVAREEREIRRSQH